MKTEKTRLLKLDNNFNTRDLGGIKISDKSYTKYKICIRSGNIDKLSDNDITYLREYGLKTVIDLRPKSVVENFPDKLASIPGVAWYNIDVKSNCMEHNSRGEDYIKFVEYTGDGNYQKQVLDIIANSPDGAILFHCTFGKDRTGIITMFLLGILGVDDEDIINNYTVSFDLLKEKPNFIKVIEEHRNEVITKIYSPRERIESAMRFIKENYGDFQNYFLKCGVNSKTIDKIKNKLTYSLP